MGSSNRKLLELRAELGVEVSGHHFFGVLEGGDDGLFTALVVLRLLAATDGRLADWLRRRRLASHHARRAHRVRG